MLYIEQEIEQHGTPANNNLNPIWNFMVKKKTRGKSGKWSAEVTLKSAALDLEEGVFTWHDPRKIALSLKKSADASKRRKSSPFRSAMSMLVFYINRAGNNLDHKQRMILEQAKQELRSAYHKEK